MTSTPSSSRWTLAYALLLVGCGRPAPANFPATDAWPERRRQPDGVAVDPASLAPTPARSGRTDALGPIVLVPPLAPSLAQKTVAAFFDAITRQDLPALAALLTERAGWASPVVPGMRGAQAIAVWTSRFQKLDYRQLAVVPVVREAELEVYAEGELDGALPGRPLRPPEMAPADVLVRARIVTTRIGAERLLGDEIAFVLRPSEGRYRIALLLEDFQLP